MKPIILLPIILGSALLIAGGVILGVGIASSASIPPVTKTYDLTDDFNKININTTISEIEFKTSEDANKKVVCQETEKDIHDVKVDDGELKIKYNNTRKWYERIFNFSFHKIKVTVYLPAGEYGDLAIDSDTGNIIIPEDYTFATLSTKVDTGNVKYDCKVKEDAIVTSSTGDITFTNLTAKNLTAKASTGKIKLNSVNVNEMVTIKTSTGNISLTDTTSKNMDIQASTGSVTLTRTIIQEHLKIKTSTGDVKFDRSDADTIEVKTSTGDVRGTLLTDKVFYAETDTGHINVPKSTTGGLCEIKTSTGDINVQIVE